VGLHLCGNIQKGEMPKFSATISTGFLTTGTVKGERKESQNIL